MDVLSNIACEDENFDGTNHEVNSNVQSQSCDVGTCEDASIETSTNDVISAEYFEEYRSPDSDANIEVEQGKRNTYSINV